MPILNRLILCWLIVVPMLVRADETATTAKIVSHPARRQSLPLVARPLGAGTLAVPWKTVAHAVRKLLAGDTPCLREGVYYENVSVSLAGRADAPITIRLYPANYPQSSVSPDARLWD